MAEMKRPKLGRHRGPVNPKVPHWSALRFRLGAPPLQPLPANGVDNTDGVASFGMMGNDVVGDCTCAAYYHSRQIWALGTATVPVSGILNMDGNAATSPDAITLYERITGYNPNAKPDANGNNPTDRGADENVVLKYLLTTGAPVGNGSGPPDKLLAYVQLDPRNQDDLKYAIWECGVAYIGFQCPMSWRTNDYSALKVWDAPRDNSDPPDPDEGHAVVLVAFDNTNFKAVSWGAIYTVTPAFVQTYVDQAFALADRLWVTQSGQTPLGYTAAQLEQLMNAIKQGS
jgi:hypothetical protein